MTKPIEDSTNQQAIRTALGVPTNAELSAVAQTAAGKYTKPANGIPATDLDADPAGRTLLTATSAAERKAAIGLDQVNNTSDANKPVSTATATALAGKMDASMPALQTVFDGGTPTQKAAFQSSVSVDGASASAIAGGAQIVAASIATCIPSRLSNGTETGYTYRSRPITFVNGASDIRLVFANTTTSATGEVSSAIGALTLVATLEYGGAIYPVKFAGATSVVIQPGQYVTSDVMPVDILPGEVAYTRCFISVSAGSKFALMHVGQTTSSFGAVGVDATGSTGSLSTPGAGVHYESTCWEPVAIIGRPAIDTGAILIDGDSIAWGTGDGTAVRNVFHRGFIARGLGQDTAFLSQAIASSTAADRLLQQNWPLFKTLQSCVRHCIHQMGTNDLSTGAPWQTVAGRILTRARQHRQRVGNRATFSQTTIVPKVTTTNFCSTIAGQTFTSASENTARITLNNWIRSGCPISSAFAPLSSTVGAWAIAGDKKHPITGYIEVADTIEANSSGVLARDGGYWMCGGVVDSGTATGYNNYVITDTGKNWATNSMAGRVAVLNGTTAINVVSNTATTLTLGANANVGSLPSNGTLPTYQLIDSTNCGDGIHPGTFGATLMSAPIAAWKSAMGL